MMPDTDEIEVDDITVPGVFVDKQGNRWAIPAEGLEDDSDAGSLNPFGKLTLDDRFHYQIIAEKELPAKMSEGFVPVTREECGLATLDTIERQFGTFAATNVVLDSGALVKIPKFLAEPRQKRKVKVAQAVRDITEPTPEMLARAAQAGNRKKSTSLRDESEGHIDGSLKHHVSSKIAS